MVLKTFSTFFVICVVFLIFSISRSVLEILFDTLEDNAKQKRLRQLRNIKTKKEIEFKDVMDTIADTTNKNILPRLMRLFPGLIKFDYAEIKKKLELIGWNDTFTPESFVGAVWGLRCISIPVFLFALTQDMPINVVLMIVAWACGFGLEYWVNSTVSTLNEELFSEFPDFIRIVSGYLSADIPLVQSITDSIKYVGDAWNPILKTFVIDCENKSVDFALDRMKNTVDLFEVKEFVSLIKLTLEQGGNAKEGFLSQADKIAELQKNQFVLKVGKRKMYGQIVQMPLLLINMLVLAMPTLMNAMSMLSGGNMTGF